MSNWANIFNQSGSRLGALKATAKVVSSGQAYSYPGSGSHGAGGAVSGGQDAPPSLQGVFTQMQAALDAVREMQQRFQGVMTFKAVQNSDGTFRVAINVDSGGSTANVTPYGSKQDGTPQVAIAGGMIIDAEQKSGANAGATGVPGAVSGPSLAAGTGLVYQSDIDGHTPGVDQSPDAVGNPFPGPGWIPATPGVNNYPRAIVCQDPVSEFWSSDGTDTQGNGGTSAGNGAYAG